jgi:Mg-chelatase subunit ChlI
LLLAYLAHLARTAAADIRSTTTEFIENRTNQTLLLEGAESSEEESEAEPDEQEDEDESDRDSLSDVIARAQGDLGSALRTPANRRRIPSPGNQGFPSLYKLFSPQLKSQFCLEQALKGRHNFKL